MIHAAFPDGYRWAVAPNTRRYPCMNCGVVLEYHTAEEPVDQPECAHRVLIVLTTPDDGLFSLSLADAHLTAGTALRVLSSEMDTVLA